MQPTRVKRENPIAAAVRLESELALRMTELANKSVRVCMQPPKDDGLSDAVALFGAAMSRSVALQTSWMEQWVEWGQFAQSIQGADTFSKYADRMGNIALRAEALATKQTTDALELADNIVVSYAYWINRQLDEKS